MKPPRQHSPVYTIGAAVTLLLFTAGLLATRADPPGLRLTAFRTLGVLLGVWTLGQLFVKRSVTVWAWDVSGPVAVSLAGLGALLGGVAAYCLLTTIPHH